MMPSYLIELEIQGKFSGSRNVGHSDLQKYEVTGSVKLSKFQWYDAYLLDKDRDIRHNYWTIRYRS